MRAHLVRHGSAGTRGIGQRDVDRPLDATGREQAADIAVVLAANRIVRVLSSPAVRCTQTVASLAAAHGVVVEETAALAEGTDVDVAWTKLTGVLSADGDVVLCSHGDVIPELVRRAQLRGMVVPGRSGCAKGSMWTIEFADGHPERGEYRPPSP